MKNLIGDSIQKSTERKISTSDIWKLKILIHYLKRSAIDHWKYPRPFPFGGTLFYYLTKCGNIQKTLKIENALVTLAAVKTKSVYLGNMRIRGILEIIW